MGPSKDEGLDSAANEILIGSQGSENFNSSKVYSDKILRAAVHIDSVIQMYMNKQISLYQMIDNIQTDLKIIQLCIGR